MTGTDQYHNAAKRRLARGELVLCMGLRQARTVDIAQIARAAGFDAVYIDMEHSPIGFETTSTLCAASLGIGLTPLVRIPGHSGEDMSRALDGGAQGVIIPQVQSAAEAAAAVRDCRFPPVGRRSVMGSGPALGYAPLALGEVNSRLNEDTLVIVMVETAEGIARADEIAAVAGVDMLLIGSNDLCTDMGVPGQLRHPKIREAFVTVARACSMHGRVLGVGGVRGDLELQRELVGMGARFIIAGHDVHYLMAAARKDAEQLRQLELK
jgi:2-keto-3-deoxy-L-rhamnonate aldolase RhmA